MAEWHEFDRRRFLLASVALATAGVTGIGPAMAQQVSDTRGMDPIWRDVDHALLMFFGNVEFESEGIHLDVPAHSDAGNSVPITVSIDSAMTEDDYPEVVHVLSSGNPTPHVLGVWFSPACGRGEFSSRIRLERSQTLTVAAKMRDGRHIRLDRDVSVSFGACAQIGAGTTSDIFAFEPVPRVSVPDVADQGQIVPIRAVITHPMETGLRVDNTDEWVKKRIIKRFVCQMNGEDLFRARLNSAVSTNPYFSFFARPERTSTLHFAWYDSLNLSYTREAQIEVASG